MDAIITRKFSIDAQFDPEQFTDFREIVNHYLQEIIALPNEFDDFKRTSNKAIKEFYNQYRKYANKHGIKRPKLKYYERVDRFAFQYVYSILQNYHRQRILLKDIGNLLLSTPLWWSKTVNFDTIDGPVHELDRILNRFRNLLISNLKDDKIIASGNDFEKFLKTYKVELKEKELDKLQRGFKQILGKRLNRRFKDLCMGIEKDGWETDLVKLILARKKQLCYDKKDFDRLKKQWRTEQNKELAKLEIKDFLSDFEFNAEHPIYERIIRSIFFAPKTRGRISSGSIDGFKSYVNTYLASKCLNAFYEHMGKKYQTTIQDRVQEITDELQDMYPGILNLPRFKALSIPLGMDDNRVYTIDGNIHSFRFKIGSEWKSVTIDDPRYQSLVQFGWTPRRGVLRFLSADRVELCLPLAKEVSKQLESRKVAGVDLGLKDGMVVSVYNIDTNQEIDRVFIDQQQLAGKKDEWFLDTGNNNFPNLKGKLFSMRKRGRYFQGQRMSFKHKNKKQTKAYRYLRQEEKQSWLKISNIHGELINQFSTRLVSFCLYHNIGHVSLENLKWSSHSAKELTGQYLSHWQVHWFFAQIQERVETMALLHGIKVFKVNPKHSSTNCHKCKKKGKRDGKWFVCKSCGWQGDADLNAARNIAKRGIRKSVNSQKKLQQKLYAPTDGSVKPTSTSS